MADGTKSDPSTSTPAPNSKTATTKKLFRTSLALSPIQKKNTMLEMVIKAIEVVGLPRKGASLPSIKKFILDNSDPSSRSQASALKKAILKGIESGILIRPQHCIDAHGVSGSFKVAPTSKKVRKVSKEKEIMPKTVKSQKSNAKVTKPSTENVKKQKPVQNTKEAVKKASKKNVNTVTGTIAKETKKNPSSLVKLETKAATTKKVTKNSPVSSKILKKSTKKDLGSLPKKVAKKGSKSEPSISNANSESAENFEGPDQKSELPKQKRNKTKVLKKEKTTKTNVPKIKNSEPINKMEKHKKVIQPKKRKENDSNIKNISKQAKTKAAKIVADFQDLDLTRKDLSDTELDQRPNRLKSLKSYASDTELEISKRATPQNKKIKPERKALTKKFEKCK